jgi:uncharacterized protein (TIGR02145 family)
MPYLDLYFNKILLFLEAKQKNQVMKLFANKQNIASSSLVLFGFSLLFIGCTKEETKDLPDPVYDKSINLPLPEGLSPVTFSAGAGATDADGNTYSSVVLGNGQEWMTSNLKTTKYSNGDVIPDELGAITTTTITNVGFGYKDGSYTNVQLTGGNGTGAAADITIVGGVATNVTIVNFGTEYLSGDVLAVIDSVLSDTVLGCCLRIRIDATPWQQSSSGVYSHYDFDNSNDNPYGKLYNYFVVADSRNVCPTGWHVPTDAEWNSLVVYLDPTADTTTAVGTQSLIAGGRMKGKGKQYWGAPNAYATNEIGFSALPAGSRDEVGHFDFINESVGFWTSTELNATDAYSRDLGYGSGRINRNTIDKKSGFSIRCIKN